LPTPITSPGGAGARDSCAPSDVAHTASATGSNRRAALEKRSIDSGSLNPNMRLTPRISLYCRFVLSLHARARGSGRHAATYASATSARRASEELRPIRQLIGVGCSGARELADEQLSDRVDAE